MNKNINNKLILNKKEQSQHTETERIDLFWKAREFKPWKKSVDWYWTYWIAVFSFIGIVLYFYQGYKTSHDYFFAILIFLVALVAVMGHKKDPAILEYRINNDSLILDNGKKTLPFEAIESFNIDYDYQEILINTKNKYQKLITIPFEPTHNIKVIEKILSSRIAKDETLAVPTLERIFEKMLGF